MDQTEPMFKKTQTEKIELIRYGSVFGSRDFLLTPR